MRKFLNSLSGRFLLLTIIFVMLAEVLIFVPSVARFRQSYLNERLERAQIASLSLLASSDDMVNPALEVELLNNAEVLSITLRRDEIRELVLNSPMPEMVDQTFDLRGVSNFQLIMDAMRCLFIKEPRLIRVIGEPVKGGGTEIEIELDESSLQSAMLAYGGTIFVLSLLISVITAALLFLAVRAVIVRPIGNVVASMVAFQERPEDHSTVINPNASVTELRNAEEALQGMQSRIAASLKQKDRLAQLGGAVAKVSHDLRNMLTTAQLVSERLEMSEDPLVARTAPKLLGSLDRAINLCEQTLAFGKAEEPAPSLRAVAAADLFDEVIEAEELRMSADNCSITAEVPAGLEIVADPEQMYRVLMNLSRNARQAIENSNVPGEVKILAGMTGDDLWIDVRDTGPGLPKKAIDHLFKPFEGGARRGGTGLGLTIAAELVAGHGGSLELTRTGPEGTTFRVTLPHKALLGASGARAILRPQTVSQ